MFLSCCDQLIGFVPNPIMATAFDSIAYLLDTYKEIAKHNPRARIVIEKVLDKEIVTLSVEASPRSSRADFSKRKSPSTIRRNNLRAQKFQENKAGRKDPSSSNPPQDISPDKKRATQSCASPPSGTSPPRPPHSTPVTQQKRKHSEASNVSELEASPIPQLDGAVNVQANDTEKHSKDNGRTASDIGNKISDTCTEPNSWMNDLLEQFNDRMDRTFDLMVKKEEEKSIEIHEVLHELNSLF